jgi:hypothetical protein
MYWDNIDPRIVETQRRVFAHFGLSIDQRERSGVDHCDFLDAYMTELGENDVAVLVDVDCFPLNRQIVAEAFAAARAGRLFGCAQSSNYVDPDRLFIAPMFMAISRRTWDGLGRPSFRPVPGNDVAQHLYEVAVAAGVEIEMLHPWGSIVPKWRLGDIGFFGLGTFYKRGVFHLYESRETPFRFILFEVGEAVLNDRPIDYLALMQRALNTRGNRRWARRFRRWRKAIRPRNWLSRLRGGKS